MSRDRVDTTSVTDPLYPLRSLTLHATGDLSSVFVTALPRAVRDVESPAEKNPVRTSWSAPVRSHSNIGLQRTTTGQGPASILPPSLDPGICDAVSSINAAKERREGRLSASY